MDKTFDIKINRGNSTFDDDQIQKLADCLREIAGNIESGFTSGAILNSNGNNWWELTSNEQK